MSNGPDTIWSNPDYGTTTLFDYDAGEDKITLNTVQDVEPAIEINKALMNDNQGRRFGDGKLVASIPIVVMQQLVQQGILSSRWAVIDEPRFRAWLNSSENRFFRTFPGDV